MKKLIYLSLLLLTNSILSAQDYEFTPPDFKKIEKSIKDTKSNLHYPKLLKRYIELDSTLTITDYRHLYYGYTFQKEYQPYWKSPTAKEMKKYFQSENIDSNEYNKIIKLLKISIDDFPFDLRSLNLLGYIYHLKGEKELATKTSIQFHGILNAILSSGNGFTCENGFYVISTGHEYSCLNMLQLRHTSQSLKGSCDYLEIDPDKKKGIYFRIDLFYGKL